MHRKIPLCIRTILSGCGYDNAISIKLLDEDKIIEVEAFIEKSCGEMLKNLSCCVSDVYQNIHPFRFVPAHKNIILDFRKALSHNLKNSEENDCIEPCFEYCSTLLKKLIQESKKNARKVPTQYRYDDIIKYFSIYVYMVCGKAGYDILSHNLPIPKRVSIRKYFSR